MPDPVVGKFQELPIGELIAEPLKAESDSQQQLASSAFESITKIGDANPNKKEPQQLTFEIEQLTQDSSVTSKINVPFLGLVPIPALLVEDVTIGFQMEVTDTATEESASTSEAEASYNGALFFGKRLNKNQAHASERHQRSREEIRKIIDKLTSTVEPVEID